MQIQILSNLDKFAPKSGGWPESRRSIQIDWLSPPLLWWWCRWCWGEHNQTISRLWAGGSSLGNCSIGFLGGSFVLFCTSTNGPASYSIAAAALLFMIKTQERLHGGSRAGAFRFQLDWRKSFWGLPRILLRWYRTIYWGALFLRSCSRKS